MDENTDSYEKNVSSLLIEETRYDQSNNGFLLEPNFLSPGSCLPLLTLGCMGSFI